MRSLGLHGEERIAGVVTGAAYPDALAPIVEGLDGLRVARRDVGGGLGGASQWIAILRRRPSRCVVVEPERASAAAAELFPCSMRAGRGDGPPVGSGAAVR